jgi:predicted phage-related endonuclease
MNNIDTQVADYQDNLTALTAVENKITQAIAGFQEELATLKQRDENLRDELKVAMKANGVKKFDNDFLSITYVAETERVTIDTKKLKEEKPDLWNEYSKTTPVKDSVRIKIK